MRACILVVGFKAAWKGGDKEVRDRGGIRGRCSLVGTGCVPW